MKTEVTCTVVYREHANVTIEMFILGNEEKTTFGLQRIWSKNVGYAPNYHVNALTTLTSTTIG